MNSTLTAQLQVRSTSKRFFLLLGEVIGYSLEAPHEGASNEYSQYMLSLRNKKTMNSFWFKKCFIWSCFTNGIHKRFKRRKSLWHLHMSRARSISYKTASMPSKDSDQHMHIHTFQAEILPSKESSKDDVSVVFFCGRYGQFRI